MNRSSGRGGTLLKLTSRRPGHATVVAYLALFFAMSGTAYAATTIGSDDVVDESLRSVDLKNGAAVRSEDVVNDSVPGGGLSGKDIKESTLKLPVNLLGDAEHARVGYESINIPALEAWPYALAVNQLAADYRCPDFPAENDGILYLDVNGPGDLFIDNGESNPTYIRVPDQQDFRTAFPSKASGEAFTVQYEFDGNATYKQAVSTLFISIAGRPGLAGVNHGSCHVQAQIFDTTK
ncbi:hypothetical protein [Nocardioides sp.]|jgi:hypothetical protein|uniref:hypothetical protein n=1 Tax=Nocardioides sp. TaxID=35761 RepID=UPI0031FECFBC|nr:hypothetical protein [Nocardioides sp.]